MAKKKIGVTLDEDLHKKVKSRAPLRGITIEKAYDQALRTWLGDESEPEVDSARQELHEALDRIMDGRDEALARIATLSILSWAAEAARPRTKLKAKPLAKRRR
jgi:hypothetical protein